MLHIVKNIEEKRAELPQGYDIEVVKNEWGFDCFYPKWQKSNGGWDYFYVFSPYVNYRDFTLRSTRRKTECSRWSTALAQITLRRKYLHEK